MGIEAPNILDITVWRVRWLLHHINPDIIFAVASEGGVFCSPLDSSLGVGLRSVVLHGHSTSLRPYSTALNLIQSTT